MATTNTVLISDGVIVGGAGGGSSDDKMLTFSDVPITWEEETVEEGEEASDYPWTGTLACDGVTSDYSADCRLSAEMVTSGIYASFTNTGTNKVYIYASEEGASTCPVVIATKVV